MHLLDEFLLLFGLKVIVPLGQAGLSSAILDQNELDRHLDDVGGDNETFEIQILLEK